MIALKFNVTAKRTLDEFVNALPTYFAYALNDSLNNARDKITRDIAVSITDIKGPRGSRKTAARQRATARAVLKVRPGEPTHLSGDVSIDFGQPQQIVSRLGGLSAQEMIRGFVNSTAPQLVGKSKKERIRQALGLYYRIKRGLTYRQQAAQIQKDVFVDAFNHFMTEEGQRRFPRQALRAFTKAKAATRR